MGYITRYGLKVLDLDGKTNKQAEYERVKADAKRLNELGSDEMENYKPEYLARIRAAATRLMRVGDDVFEEIEYMEGGGECKWYEHEDHMKRLSKAFPEFVFELNGEGEENGDIWTKWFCAGKMQGGKAQIVYPEFNPKGFK